MYYAPQPDLVILLGTRTILSLLGVAAIAIGQWNWDRANDGESNNKLGSTTATNNNNNNNNNDVEGGKSPSLTSTSHNTAATNPARPSLLPWTWHSAVGGTLSGGEGGNGTATGMTTAAPADSYALHDEPPASLVTAPHTTVLLQWWSHPLRVWSTVSVLGWFLVSISCLLDPSKWSAVNANPFAVSAMIVALGVGGAFFAYQSQCIDRPHVPPYLCGWAFAVVVWGILAALGNDVRNTPNWAVPLGTVLVALSLVTSWHSRRTGGDMYATTGRCNARPVVFHLTGPLLVWGYYWIWIGFNAVPAQPDAWYLPIFWGGRTALAHVGAALALLALYATGYAYDEMPSPASPTTSVAGATPKRMPPIPETLLVVPPSPQHVASSSTTANATTATATTPTTGNPTSPNHDTANHRAMTESLFAGPGFGALGYFGGSVWEIKLVLTGTWLLWGIAAFLPSVETVGPAFVFLALALNGVAWSIFYEMAVRAIGHPNVARRWAMNGGATLALLALILSLTGGGLTAAVLSLPGAACLFVGQMVLHLDRKRGHYFVASGGTLLNPNPRVFSHGSPLTSLGFVLLAWAVSLRA